MQTSVVVTPRERFSVFETSLRSLFSTIPESVPVLVFDSGAPENVKAKLRALQQERPFELHETAHFLLPPQVRNLCQPLIETKYVCFCDNDVVHEPGWLQALEDNAERNGSAAVAPLTLIGPSRKPMIHHAGSELSVYLDKAGRPRLKSIHRLDGVPLEEARDNDFFGISEQCQEFEYHCALLRTDVLQEIDGHDERQTKHDHLNDSLRILMRGHKITFEREAVIMYHAFDPFTDEDWPFFFYRWSLQGSIDSDRAIGECWQARKNYENRELDFVRMHRRRAIAGWLPKWIKKVPSEKLRSALKEHFLSRLEARYEPRPATETRHVPDPSPPPNGLQLAGIAGAEQVRVSA